MNRITMIFIVMGILMIAFAYGIPYGGGVVSTTILDWVGIVGALLVGVGGQYHYAGDAAPPEKLSLLQTISAATLEDSRLFV